MVHRNIRRGRVSVPSARLSGPPARSDARTFAALPPL